MTSVKNPFQSRRQFMTLLIAVASLLLTVGALSATAEETDNVKPRVTDFEPEDGASNVEIDTTIKVTFSEDIKTTHLDSYISLVDGRGFQVDKRVSYSSIGHRALVDPVEPLRYSMWYKVTVSSFIEDLAGNPLENPMSFTFNTTMEKTPPTVVSTIPKDNARDVSINSSVKVVFSEEMDVESLRTGIVVHDTLDNPVIGNTTPAEDGLSVTFDPLFSYAYGETYNVTVLDTVKDLAGNPMGDDLLFTFTVQLERIPPRVVGLEPVDQSQFIRRNVVMLVTFSEPMNSTSLADAVALLDPAAEVVPTTPYYNSNNYTLTVRPDQPLGYQTLYTIVVKTSAQDLAGNHLSKEMYSTFTTEKLPQQPPRIETRIPPEDEFSWYEGLSITFSIEASDINDDILVYEWEVNGEPKEGETFNEFVFYPEPGSEGAYKVEVSVNDGVSAPVKHFWIVNVVRSTTNGQEEPGREAYNWTYFIILLVMAIIIAVLVFGYMRLMDRRNEILARARRRLRPLTLKKTPGPAKPPSYEEMYLRTDSVYSKKSPEFKPVATPEGAKVKGKAVAGASVDTGPWKGTAPQLLEAKEVKMERAKVGPHTTDAPELKKTRAPGALVCPKCGQKAIEAAHGRIWCDTCGFLE